MNTYKKDLKFNPGGFQQFKRRSKPTMSDFQISSFLSLAYNDSHQWSKHLDKYFDLFTSENDAQKKARTRSVMHMCNYLYYERGCSYKRIFQNLTRQQGEEKVAFEKSLLPLETLLSFCCCISEIENDDN